MKKYVKEFLDRAVEKYTAHQKRRADRETQNTTGSSHVDGVSNSASAPALASFPDTTQTKESIMSAEDRDDVTLSDNGVGPSETTPELKRKREGEVSPSLTPSDGPIQKRLREDEAGDPSPPPPPPPPPESAMEDVMTAEQQFLREQEEALMRENEEAQRLDDEANKTKKLEEAAPIAQNDIINALNKISEITQAAAQESLQRNNNATVTNE